MLSRLFADYVPPPPPPPPPEHPVIPPDPVHVDMCWCWRSNGLRWSHGPTKTYYLNGYLFNLTPKYTTPMHFIGNNPSGATCTAFNEETNEFVRVLKLSNPFTNIADAKRIIREIKVLRHMNHENILSLKDIIPQFRTEADKEVYMVLELAEYNLLELVSSKTLPEDFVKRMFYQLLRGLKYLHSGKVVHQDIKLSSLLVNKSGQLKISDFGIGRVNTDPEYITERIYRAPELLLLDPPIYSEASDVWAAGVAFMHLLTGAPLFRSNKDVHLVHSILQLVGTPVEEQMFLDEGGWERLNSIRIFYSKHLFTERYPEVDPSALHLAERMLAFDPTKRITVNQALNHPYLRYTRTRFDEPVCETQFNSDFEGLGRTVEKIKKMIYREAHILNDQQQ